MMSGQGRAPGAHIPPSIAFLRSPAAVRERSESLFEHVRCGGSEHFRLDLARLAAATDVAWEVLTEAYPDPRRVPVHGRINHFGVGGRDRLAWLEAALPSAPERARALTDLIVTSVLLDAGAGPEWRYTEPSSGLEVGRSEGLALASLEAWRQGLFSGDPRQPWRADAEGLANLTTERLAEAFQVRANNPLLGLEGRAALLRRLGTVLGARSEAFAGQGRVGGLCDVWMREAIGGQLPAARVLGGILEALGPIWPPRTQCLGVELGDVWFHPAAGGHGPTRGLVPFHKLSQWLSYSLLPALALAGLEVVNVGELTGLAEYRNGGLFVDTGVIAPKHPGVTRDVHEPSSELVVEWRALTVVLLDRLATGLRQRSGLDAESLPLGKVLEGASWAAGRRLAERLRQGAPPIRVQSDGTLF
ncbi:MAG TPA: DUF1688 family protein [Polyangiaceae bacterium]|nr:DUF1688 family protein [Polyangiaceae bacterium]